MMRINRKKLSAVLANKGGDLGGGFQVKKVATVEHPFNPKKHKPEDYQFQTRKPVPPLDEPIITLAAGRPSFPSPAKNDTISDRIDAVLKSTKTLLDSMGRV